MDQSQKPEGTGSNAGYRWHLLMRAYAKRTDEANAQAAAVIGSISKTILGS